MSDTAATDAIQEASDSVPPAPAAPPPVTDLSPKPDPGMDLRTLAWKALTALASLRLTVVLFVFSLLLVYFGTLAQVDQGIWTVVEKYFRSLYVWIPFQVFTPMLTTFFGFAQGTRLGGGFPFPGGWLIGAALLANLLAAHAIRFKFTWKRSGILLLHAGLIVLMLGELITGLYAVEGSMSIDEGASSNYVQHHRQVELAIIDRSDPKNDDVVVVPGSQLGKGSTVSNALLPFDIEVVEFMKNSGLTDKPPEPNPATAGYGLGIKFPAGQKVFVAERPEVSGTDPNQKVDVPSAYLTFKKKGSGEVLGTYLMSVWFYNLSFLAPDQTISVDGKDYAVSLRFLRTYKPYSIQLLEFRFDRHTGVATARNFSSKVILHDPERSLRREVTISMNDPLRYRGETFYQQSFDEATEQTTVLQVVQNPGWLLPYVACTMVSLGMLIHFGLHLVQFLRLKVAS